MNVPVRPKSRVSLHLVDDQGLLLDPHLGRIYAIDAVASFIWIQLDAGLLLPELLAALRDTFRLSPERAAEANRDVAAQWLTAGLATDAHSPDASPSSVSRREAFPDGTDRAAEPCADPATAGGDLLSCDILDARIALSLPPGPLSESVRDAFAPLSAPAIAPHLICELRRDGDALCLFQSGRHVATCADDGEAVPFLKHHLLELALRRSTEFCAVHAAAVATPRGCLMLVGPSGSGKSTLAAALAAVGFAFVADDTVVLTESCLAARPLPFGICLKDTSWGLVAPHFPDLQRRPAYRRPDGKTVRYLTPPPQWRVAPDRRLPVHALVFPRHAPTHDLTLLPLSVAGTIKHLLPQIRLLGGAMNELKLRRLLEWIRCTRRHALVCPNITSGAAALRDLCDA